MREVFHSAVSATRSGMDSEQTIEAKHLSGKSEPLVPMARALKQFSWRLQANSAQTDALARKQERH